MEIMQPKFEIGDLIQISRPSKVITDVFEEYNVGQDSIGVISGRTFATMINRYIYEVSFSECDHIFYLADYELIPACK